MSFEPRSIPLPGCRTCDRVTVTRVVVLEGKGVVGDPAREVIYFFDDNGNRIARRDHWEENSRDHDSISVNRDQEPHEREEADR